MNKAKWIWYFGDYEYLHLQKVNSRRTERDYPFPTFWKQPEIYSNVRFRKQVEFNDTETFTVTAKGIGFVLIGTNRYTFNTPITLPKGKYQIEVRVYNQNGLPCIFVQGNTLISDQTWLCSPYDNDTPADCNEFYADISDDPNVFKFSYERIYPTSQKFLKTGVLYDFGKETFARLLPLDVKQDFTVYFGETEQEATDTDYSYIIHTFTASDNGKYSKAFGFRYFFIPSLDNGLQPQVEVYYEYLPQALPIAKFECSDDELNEIWQVAGRTFELNSREFYLDGIKRDRWVWSGDAYQSYFTNRYYAFDKEIARRTIIGLAGKEKITQHINTINDYTFYWLISIYDYYITSGDLSFVARIYPRMKEYLDFCISRLDANGLVEERKGDWIYIDWAEMDKVGPICAEQMLLYKSLDVFCKCCQLLGEDCYQYNALLGNLKTTINEKYWDERKGAYIDGFITGKRHVTRHANIFAVLFDVASPSQKDSIIKNVFLNDNVAQISTPYFKFYELEAICQTGDYSRVLNVIKDYWGAMIKAGATSFWEEFNINTPWQEQLSMYEQKYGKSLCHAWGSTPIYIIGRHLLGLYPTSAGYKTFCLEPHLEDLQSVRAVLPVNGGTVTVEKTDKLLKIYSTVDGGSLRMGDKNYSLDKNLWFETQI